MVHWNDVNNNTTTTIKTEFLVEEGNRVVHEVVCRLNWGPKVKRMGPIDEFEYETTRG